MEDLKQLHVFAEQIAALCKQASAAILSYYGDKQRMHISQKSNATPVTAADIAAHKILSSTLPQILPLEVMSEESEGVKISNSMDYWLIDPLDGTREFVNHTGEFAVLVARIKDRRPCFGLIYEPLTDKYWYAGKDLGAYRASPEGEIERIVCRPRGQIPTVITAHARISRRHNKYFTALFGEYKHLHKGSALKFCEIAEGKADIYPKLSAATSEWDSAAGDILLHEAGGGMSYYPGITYLYGKNVFGVNPPFLAYGKASAPEIARYLSFMRRQISNEGRIPPYFHSSEPK